MSKKSLDKTEINMVTHQILSDIDNYSTGGSSYTPLPIDGLILTRPILRSSLVAKVLNRLFHLPLYMFKRSIRNYVKTRMIQDAQLNNRIQELRNSQERLSALVEQKNYEYMKHNDAIKSEIMAELNKDSGLANVAQGTSTKQKTLIKNEDRVAGIKKINVGSGSHILEDYINLDHRDVKGVDIVGDLKDIPVKKGTIEEVFASHVVEHFTERQIKLILKHWYDLLALGGKIRIIVPDIANMAKGFGEGKISWEQLRLVTLGGQDYDSDYHLNMFSVEYITKLAKSEFPKAKIKLIDSARPNGECLELEFEIEKTKEA